MSLPSIILDTDKTTPIYELPLKIRQGDTGDELQVTLGKSFEKYTDLSTVDIELIAKTPDQRLIKQAVTDKSVNTFKVKFPDEMYTNVGVFRNMYFKVGDDSTSSIKLVVLQGIGSIKEAGSYIDDFETLIKEAESYVSALKDFADTGNAKIDDKVTELTGKMQSFVDKSKEDLDAAKAAWKTFQSSSQTEFTDAQDKRASDFNSQKSGFETDFNEQQTDFENRFKALLATLQDDYDNFKTLINKDVADLNTSLDSLDAQATDVKNKFDALKAQLDLAVQNISGVRTNLLLKTYEPSSMTGNNTTNQVQKTYALSRRLEKGTTVTISFDAISTAPVKFDVQNDGIDGGCWTGFSSTVDTTKKHYAETITLEGFADLGINMRLDNVPSTTTITVSNMKLELGSNATDWCPNPSEIATNDGVQTAITNALDKADYPTTSEVDNKISTGVGQAKTYAEQSIKKIIGAAPETLDTIAELADAVTKNKDGVQAINEGITKKADKTELANYESKAEMISQTDYEAKKEAGTLEDKFYIVTDDTEAS
ncbi:phage tail protein [Companilactobacillus farciminis]|uniref:phage tail protein n=1 Tax=Companilactobacillus farciminis TaxID=1612 RepID=UPI0024204CCF|nr:phage tail protein [Companilactobacillus farciminis]